ncbi:MAG: sugar ABC transporter permease [Propionicimonas sp.]|nr:sugar ABC transporter permease [Propionicimonas sp.]
MFFIVPLFLTVWMSLHNWPLLGNVRKLVGGANYGEALTDSVFGESIVFTIKFALIITPIQLVLGYALATLVRGAFKGVAAIRATYFAPVVVGAAAGAYVFLVLVRPETGLFDQILQGLGIMDGPAPWLTDPDWALATVILMTTWKSIGTAIILMMVGMQAIPEEVNEAAVVDGANWWQRELFVTLPLMKSTIALVLMLTLTGSFLAFDQFFVMTHGGPGQSTTTVVMWIYTTAFVRYRLGYSAALSVILMALLVILTVAQIRALRDRSEKVKA